MTETTDPDRKAGMDALSDVLRVAHLTGGVFLHAELVHRDARRAGALRAFSHDGVP
jgi:hypothetical protein